MNLLVIATFLLAAATISQATNTYTAFSTQLFNVIPRKYRNQNIVISPLAIKASLVMAFSGAEGKTADDLRQGVFLGGPNVTKLHVAKEFRNLLKKMPSNKNVAVKLASRMYVRKDYQIVPQFNNFARKYFSSRAENVDFSKKNETAAKINSFIEQRTEHNIQNFISPEDIKRSTALMLVNAISFKGLWRTQFNQNVKRDFYLKSEKNRVRVDVAYRMGKHGYANLTDLNADALLMAYNNSDIRMLVLLPYKRNGLSQLERKLKRVDLLKLLPQFQLRETIVSLPKFKVESDIPLKSTLKKLGVRHIFKASANFSGIVKTQKPVFVSDAKHKAFIEIDEKLAEAQDSSKSEEPVLYRVDEDELYLLEPQLVSGDERISFDVDHPFFFAVMDKKTVYFVGHIINPNA